MPHRILWKIKFSTSIRTTKISELVVGPCIYFISLWWGQEREALEINILGTFNKNTRLICIYSSFKAIKIWTFICITFILIVNISLGNKKINLLANLLTITKKRHTWSYTNMFLIVKPMSLDHFTLNSRDPEKKGNCPGKMGWNRWISYPKYVARFSLSKYAHIFFICIHIHWTNQLGKQLWISN